MRFTASLTFAVALLLVLAGCTDSRVAAPQAYVAPATLRLRSELSSRSTNGAELKHGDHLVIVEMQRRMARVRTDKGAEGWVDSLQLLSPEQMDQLKRRRQRQAAMPAEGSATAYEVLNIHIDPDRQSPAFAQIPEGGSVSILGRKVTPKVNTAPRPPGIAMARPQTLSRKQRKDQQNRPTSFRLPPRPAPPKPPANWQELSAERIDGEAAPAKQAKVPAVVQAKPQGAAKPVVLEDWTLVRTKRNDVGWVLSRNLLMSIPDEVAQYAEGKHITAFFDLGPVSDDLKGTKHNWLWTTAARALPYDFDSWRVFLWNTRRHRYETSFRQRDVVGYFPVHVDAPEADSPLRNFQLITKDKDGKMRRRTYTFDGHLVHIANTEEYDAAVDPATGDSSAIDTKDLAAKAAKPGWFKRQWSAISHRLLGH